MQLDVLLGLQWGDEGKGKIVDALTPKYDVIARFQGGPNAGHTLEFNNVKHVLHSIPSGIFNGNKINLIGNGVVLDPAIFKKEIDGLEKHDIDLRKNLLISSKAHLILPTHKLLDAAYEKAKGKSKIGSTLKGIGPTYTDKISRNGLRVGDIISPKFAERYMNILSRHKEILKQHEFEYDLDAIEKEWFTGVELMKEFNIVESDYEINKYLSEGKSVMAEGAQGTLLDIDFGSYPFVTSSNTISAGACTGMGVAPNKIKDIFGIFKAYCTRVGSGPFPTELFDADGETLAKNGHEFGSTTGRARRCGWLDLVALKYAVMINGVTQMFMMKSDVLSGFDTIKVATAYEIDGETTDRFPFDTGVDIKPVYKEFKGWSEDITKVKTYDELPVELKDYVKFIEDETGVPIKIVSVGPDRTETIYR